MRITHVHMHQFRCFEQAAFTFTEPIILLEGDNGAGKTSILEALYYACYIRSFRTHAPRELIKLGHRACSVNVTFVDSDKLEHELQVGFQSPKRRVRLDGKVVHAYDELLSCMRVVAVTDGDAHLIRGGPEGRRSFIDEYILIHEPTFLATLKLYASIVKQRNALIQNQIIDQRNYEVWTRKLWDQTVLIQQKRVQYVDQLNKQIKDLCDVNKECPITINSTYTIKKPLGATYEESLSMLDALRGAELALGYSLFGAHWDDVNIQVNAHQARSFASRGQQKAAVLLLKIAQARELVTRYGGGILLLDDVMLDFDDRTLKLLVTMLAQLPVQLFFTSAQGAAGVLQQVLRPYKPQIVKIAPQMSDQSSIDLIAKSSHLPPLLNF